MATKKSLAAKARDFLSLQQAQNRAAVLVRLGKHGLGCLQYYVVLGVARHLLGHVRVPHGGVAGLGVLAGGGEVRRRELKAVLRRPDVGLLV